MHATRTMVVIGCALLSVSARSGIADPRPGAAPMVTLETGLVRHAFTSPMFGSTTAVTNRGTVMREPHERAIAIGPHFLLAIDLSQHVYSGVELAAGGLASGPTVVREGVNVSGTGFYIGLRVLAGRRFELGRLSLAAEIAPGLNDVSFESPSMVDNRGNPVRFEKLAYEVDVRVRFDVRVTPIVVLGLLAGVGMFDHHDLSVALSLRLRPRAR